MRYNNPTENSIPTQEYFQQIRCNPFFNRQIRGNSTDFSTDFQLQIIYMYQCIHIFCTGQYITEHVPGLFIMMRPAGAVLCTEEEESMGSEEKEYRELFRELDRYEKQGVYMEMEGKQATPTQIVRAHMLKENSGYMRDYILNEEGDVKELYFYQINLQKL